MVSGRVLSAPLEVLQARRDQWATLWNRAEADPQMALDLLQQLRRRALAHPVAPIDSGQVRRGLQALQGTKGIGLDLWHPLQWLAGPEAFLEELAQLLNQAELELAWPTQARLAKIVVITKPN
eukprot:2440146-Alexandrium_andersonii.AAC.1